MRRGDRVGVAVLAGLAAAVYVVLSLVKVANFKAGAYDLVIFDQAVRSYSRFQLPIAIVKGVHNDFGAGFSVLGDHWSPILAVLAPLYWVFDGPTTLLVAQAVLLAAAIVPLWVFTWRTLGRWPAYAVAAAYAISWPVVETVAFDFHEVAFVPLLTGVMLERWQAGRRVPVILAAVALLCVKEDMGLLVAGFGLFLLTRAGWRVMGGSFVAGGLFYTWLATQILVPAFGGRPDYYWAYGALGPNVSGVVKTALTDPLTIAAQLWTPPVKLATLALLLAVTLGAALLSPLLLATIPLLAERMLASSFPNWWVPSYHYNAFLIVLVFAAAADGITRLRPREHPRAPHALPTQSSPRPPAQVPPEPARPSHEPAQPAGSPAWPRSVDGRLTWPGSAHEHPAQSAARLGRASVRPAWLMWVRGPLAWLGAVREWVGRSWEGVVRGWAAGVLGFAVGAVPFFSLAQVADPESYRLDQREQAAAAAVAKVPDGVLVEAANNLAPALTSRDRVLLWDRTPRWAPWVVADQGRKTFPFKDLTEQQARIRFLLANGYQQIYASTDYMVLHRPGPTPTL
ncbi:DUF2079 domain-containing protein [Nonomuraea sediminis]|uniref:DUF2079 domain-containing protein n=1 Tax=Nonomuraea sediminis TaxID=2835864 RepID=UPI001BDBE529|nr:DUF2079 domain-containing protein [Nonomuraea sediminis]